MTVKELVDASPYCDLVEIVIRNGGRWVQGYRIGKNAKVYPCEISAEVIERKKLDRHDRRTVDLEDGEEVDTMVCRDLPMKVICKDVSKMPSNIGALMVRDIQPRHVPQLHREALTHNDFAYELTCEPEGWKPEPPKKVEEPDLDYLDGQMSIEEMIGEEYYANLGDYDE